MLKCWLGEPRAAQNLEATESRIVHETDCMMGVPSVFSNILKLLSLYVHGHYGQSLSVWLSLVIT